MEKNCRHGKRRNDRGLVVPESGERLLTQLWLGDVLLATGRWVFRGSLQTERARPLAVTCLPLPLIPDTASTCSNSHASLMNRNNGKQKLKLEGKSNPESCHKPREVSVPNDTDVVSRISQPWNRRSRIEIKDVRRNSE